MVDFVTKKQKSEKFTIKLKNELVQVKDLKSDLQRIGKNIKSQTKIIVTITQ